MTKRTRFRWDIALTLFWISCFAFVKPGAASTQSSDEGFFERWTQQWLDSVDSNQKNYGMAVTDVDNDGAFEVFVAGYSGANFVLKYDKSADKLINIAQKGSEYETLRDEPGQAIGVAACDIDGDGKEEIYVLNTNQAYAGRAAYGDKLFKWRNGAYYDLFSDDVNAGVSAKDYAGRSVACLDRFGSGKYGFLIATYSFGGTGSFALIEMNVTHPQNDVKMGSIVLKNSAKEAGLDKSTGGRGVVVGPILNRDGKLDIFFDNEGNSWMGNEGANYLMKNLGNGSFIDVARPSGVADPEEAGRGVALADLNQDGMLDIIYGNWDGPHRIFIQTEDNNGKKTFVDKATSKFKEESLVRTVMVADFDNDAYLEIMINNIYSPGNLQPNRLFKVTPPGAGKSQLDISVLAIGDAEEKDGFGTGGAYLDFDGDGKLEMMLSHGESYAQSLEVYKVKSGHNFNWIRINVRSRFGAPARGAVVKIIFSSGTSQMQVIDSGSGYLCQMEPIAHFGLGSDTADEIQVMWPDGRKYIFYPKTEDVRKVIVVYHPDYVLPNKNLEQFVNANFMPAPNRGKGMTAEVYGRNVPDNMDDVISGNTLHSLQEIIPLLKETIREEVEHAVEVKSQILSDKVEQYLKRGSIRVTGMSEQFGETEEELVSGVRELGRSIGVNIDTTSISKIHRVGRKRDQNTESRPVIVVFNKLREAENLLKNKQKLKNNNEISRSVRFVGHVTVAEDLTSPRRRLMKRIRNHPGIELVSVKNGALFAKQINGPLKKVESMDDLAQLGITDINYRDIYD